MKPLMNPGLWYSNPLKLRFGAEFFRSIVPSPGVYFMLGEKNQILYIGKAKNLKARLTTYSQIKPGQSADPILEMVDYVRSIQWKKCASEEKALQLESELIRAIRPPYNILGTEPDPYLFIGVKYGEGQEKKGRSRHSENDWIDFKLSSCPIDVSEGYRAYGCFNHRKKIKSGYSALLRLTYAAVLRQPRFSYPSRITRSSPAWLYRAEIPKAWGPALDEFLEGKSSDLLGQMFSALLSNENVPPFMRPSIQNDLNVLQGFYIQGPQFTHQVKTSLRIKSKVLSANSMNRWMTRNLRLPGALNQP